MSNEARRSLRARPVRQPLARRWGRCAAAPALVAATLALLPPGSALAGAWSPRKGDGVVIVTGSFTGSARGFDADGRLQPVPDYRKFELGAYVEYGVTDWLTGVFHSSARVEAQALDVRTTAVDGLGLRARLWRSDRFVISAAATGYTPGLDRNGLMVESEPAALDARILAGWSFQVFGRPAFADGQAAYRLSAGGEDDEIRLDLTLGVTPGPRWLLLAQSFTTLSSGAPEAYRYHKLQASAVCWITRRHGLQIGAGGTVDGVSALSEETAFAAFWYRF